MTGPRVLALDLSLTASGIARPDGTLDTHRPAAKGDDRIAEIANRIEMELYDDDGHYHRDLLVAIEGPVTRSQAATVIGMVHGAVRLTLLREGVAYLIVPPAALKTYATGKGNAPKPDMRMALYKRTGHDIADDNQVDACFLRLLALDLLGFPELKFPETHRRALAKLSLPEGFKA
jgi:Holliday junction resolvasome RuvABC endonuclease subunit